ncbi:MAG: hypothetical protein ACLTST_00815 [Lachnospiraceae bacterium]
MRLRNIPRADSVLAGSDPSLGVSTIIFGSLFRFGTATVSINAGFFGFLKT